MLKRSASTADETRWRRRLPVGAEIVPGHGVHFRVWAPRCARVAVVLERGDGATEAHPLEPEGDGYFAGQVAHAAAGTRYRFRLDDDTTLLPDPASRYQPDGPHGSSQVVDPDAYVWHDGRWPGVASEGQVLYEMHVGTFTRDGTFRAATGELAALRETGITVLELLPVADFTGRFGWGYDGVDLYAPTRLYGEPDDFRAFVDAAHDHGLGVILDVVYNHLGPDGNYLKRFSEDYFSGRYRSEWGESPNFDGPNSGPVREFFTANVEYWIREFHLDGFRIDATQQVFDASPGHILAAVSRRAQEAAGSRQIYLVGENEPQDRRTIEPRAHGGHGLSALWNDDFHHTAIVALTGRNEAYYSDYHGSPQELVSVAKRGSCTRGSAPSGSTGVGARRPRGSSRGASCISSTTTIRSRTPGSAFAATW